MGRELSCFWKDDAGGGGSILRQLWGADWFICSLSEELTRKVLYSEQFIGVPNSVYGKRRRSKVEQDPRRLPFLKRKKR